MSIKKKKCLDILNVSVLLVNRVCLKINANFVAYNSFLEVVPNHFNTMDHLDNFEYVMHFITIFFFRREHNEDNIFSHICNRRFCFIVSRTKRKIKLFATL